MPAECFFLDVGQGTSQVVLLGRGRAIVIDGGPTGRIPIALLDRYVSKILALIVSHNDADHHRGALQILEKYRGAIEKLFFLQDRPLDRIGLYRLAKRLILGRAIQCCRLERNNEPRIFYDDEAGVTFEVLFPPFLSNLEAQEDGEPNATSGVLALFCGSRRIMFSGDATMRAWRQIHALVRGPFPTDVLSVSHHGGVIWPCQERGEESTSYEARVQEDLRWLYTEAFPCRHAVLSVATSNTYNHPREWVVKALRQAGAVVLCTQITSQCCDNLEEVRLKGIRTVTSPSRSVRRKELTRSGGNSRNVACAGTIVAEIGPDSVRIERLDEHQAGVAALAASTGGHPLCRKA
jgi:competence protein ComEC